MDKIKGYHIIVKGHVQGVGYRFYCEKKAVNLGLKGYVMNLPDGDVEIEICGDTEKMREFISEITRKDMSFLVTDIDIKEFTQDKNYPDFRIKFY
ncbi:MAG TPA: acylphosphatase [Candidatus Goldiibacteriota bacterium]|nr:acylphosphatase [Candidatus Goldiibacteriota bacterium]